MKSKNKTLVISGSARADSNTSKLIEYLFDDDIQHVELSSLDIEHFRYDGKYDSEKDFLDLVHQMLDAELIILATPVYWYTMSGHMKAFLDRWTDLLSIYKEKGRALKGKNIALIAQSSSEVIPEGFVSAIALTADYMDMNYLGEIFVDIRKELSTNTALKEIVAKW